MSTMEVLDSFENWHNDGKVDEIDFEENLEFTHTRVVPREGDQYYYADTKQRYKKDAQIDPSELDLTPVPTSKIWPSFPEGLTRALEPLPENCFVKQPHLSWYGNGKDCEILNTLLLQEARVCEILRASTHPNIAQYLGCVVDEDEKIKSLAWVRYDMELEERVEKDPRPFDPESFLRDFREGMQHLHGLGLIHCDLNPHNVMVKGDTCFIIDFDSCCQEGDRLGLKWGNGVWTNREFRFANRENDEYGLEKIREWLFEKQKEKADADSVDKQPGHGKEDGVVKVSVTETATTE